MQIPEGNDILFYKAGRDAFEKGIKPLAADPPISSPAWWVNEGLRDAAAGLPSRISEQPSEQAPDDLVKLYWTRASLLFDNKPDPYNEEYRKWVEDKERKKRLIGDEDHIGPTLLAVTGSVLSLISSTGVGAVLAAAYAILQLIGTYLVPASEGGWEKLTPLQRQKATLYQLHPSFEERRNTTLWASQRLDLSVPDLGPKEVFRTVGGLAIPSFGSDTIPAQVHDRRYPLYVRNEMIRAAYARAFQRTVTTHDEPVLPAVVINLLGKASMWPPPLPPIKPDMRSVPDEAKPIYDVQFRILTNQYEDDIRRFGEVSSIVIMTPDLKELAEKSGCIPSLDTPGVFSFEGLPTRIG